jgi:hypothetical protein
MSKYDMSLSQDLNDTPNSLIQSGKNKFKPLTLSLKIPYEISVGLYITFMVLLTLSIYLNKEKLDSSFLKKYYIFIYVGYILNLLNMTGFTIYYNKKKENIVGDMGKQGERGFRGSRGKVQQCSYCDYNLYFIKTKKYKKIITLDLGLEENTEIDEELLQFGFSNMGLEMEYINLSFLKDLSNQSRNSSIIKTLRTIFKFSTRMKYLSYNLNKIIKKNDFSQYITFLNPSGSTGYFPIGHSVIDRDLAHKLNAFLINGDIKFPDNNKYKVKFTFENMDILDRQGVSKETKKKMYYSFIKPDAPDGYKILGELIVKNQEQLTDLIIDTNLIACIKDSCLKEIDRELLQLMGIKISYNSDNEKVNKILNYKTNSLTYKINDVNYDGIDNERLNIFSIWRTPINTFITHTIIGNESLISSTIGYNIIDGYDKYISKGGINLTIKGNKYVTNKLKSIKIPKIIRIIYVIINQYEKFFENISYTLSLIILDLKKELTKLENMKIQQSYKQKIATKKKIGDINKKIELFENIITQINNYDVYDNFDDLFDNETQLILSKTLPKFDKMKKQLEIIPILIDSNSSLYDLLIMVYPDGLDTIISVKDNDNIKGGIKPSKIQFEILKIAKVCFPPNQKIYIPTKDCLSFNIIDIDSNKLANDLDDVLIVYEDYIKKYPMFNGKTTCETKDWEDVIKQINIMDKNLDNQLNHIKNYKELIKNRNTEMFSKSRIEFIIKEYTNIINYIKKTCPIIPNNLN